MKKLLIIFIVCLSFSTPVFAAWGQAADGMRLMLAIAGFLIITGLLFMAGDYLIKNWRSLLKSTRERFCHLRHS